MTARLAEVGLPDSVLSKKPAELSGGMRKRVGLARALVLSPELIMYDEPTTGLDPVSRRSMWEMIRRLQASTGLTDSGPDQITSIADSLNGDN